MASFRFNGDHRAEVFTLDSPAHADDIYRYRGDPVPRERPLFQGDVFKDVEIPGLDDGPGHGMVVTHPCTMRNKGLVRDRLLVGRVSQGAEVPLPWEGNYKIMPLPGLFPGDQRHWRLTFDEVGVVRTESLHLATRIAALDEKGVVLLQQRLAHHFTRTKLETPTIYAHTAQLLVEAELLETWLERAMTDVVEAEWGAKCDEQTVACDEWIGPHPASLQDASNWPAVRKALARELNSRFG